MMNDNDILNQSTDSQISYWLGVVLVAIGSGNVRAAIYQIISFYQRTAYEAGMRDAIEESRRDARIQKREQELRDIRNGSNN